MLRFVLLLFLGTVTYANTAYVDSLIYLEGKYQLILKNKDEWRVLEPSLTPKDYPAWERLGKDIQESERLNRLLFNKLLNNLKKPKSINEEVEELNDQLNNYVKENSKLQAQNEKLKLDKQKAKQLSNKGQFSFTGGSVESDDLISELLDYVKQSNSPLPSAALAVYQAKLLAKSCNGFVSTIANTKSMYPLIDGDSLVVLKTVAPQEVKVGDIIGFTHNGAKILHRVTRVRGTAWETQGDNTHTTEHVAFANLQGLAVYVVYYTPASGNYPVRTAPFIKL